MTHPSKVKGNSFEREVVANAKEYGLDAERAYASNGKALGYSEEVDVVIAEHPMQCKRRKTISNYLKIPEDAFGVLLREDRGETYLIIRYEHWLQSVS